MVIKFSPKKIYTVLKRNARFILWCTIAGFVAGILYALVMFQPVYKSSAGFLIKNSDRNVFSRGNSGQTGIFAENKKLISTQMEILQSNEFAGRIWKKVKSKNKLKIKDKKGIEKIKNAITFSNPANTDIINLTASWSGPEIANDIALAAVSAYQELNTVIETSKFSKNLKAVKKELQQNREELLQVRNKIKEFKKSNSVIDFNRESRDLTDQIRTLENKQQELTLAAASEVHKINTIAQNLGIKGYDIKNTASTGKFSDLSVKLDILQDELAGLSSKYTELHPEVKNIKSRIDRIEGQIHDQVRLNFGSNLNNKELQVSNPVNAGMMEVLINSKEKYAEIQAQKNKLTKVLNNLKQKRAEIPQREFVLTDYQQKETALERIVNNLRADQAELEVKEAGFAGDVVLIDRPVLPTSVAFPDRLELVMLIAMFSALLASLFTLTKEFGKNTYNDTDEIEKDLNTPVLGTIPWLERELYDEPDVMYAIEETASFYSLAYQKAVSSIRIKGDFLNKKAISFTSSESSKNRSTIIMNIAYSLSRTGQSVVVVDADFRTPSLGKEMGFEVSAKYSLAELLTVIGKDLQEKEDFDREKINPYVRSIPSVNDFFIIPNSGNVPDPCEFLYSDAFNCLIKGLKEKYDWVLIDVPPAIAVPDAVMAGLYVDGTIIITGLETNKNVLRKIYRQFETYNISVFGVIAREIQEKEAVFSNKYIKQMISRMMPHAENPSLEAKQ